MSTDAPTYHLPDYTPEALGSVFVEIRRTLNALPFSADAGIRTGPITTFADVANFLNAFAGDLREHAARAEADTAELQELRRQRDSLRALLGTA